MSFNSIANKTDMNVFSLTSISILFRSCYLYTEVFLMISGLLVSFSTIGRLRKGLKLNIAKEIASRYFRFMPPIAALIIFFTFILPELGEGPQWPMIIEHQAELCKMNWWRNFLMIHNFFGFENLCMANTHHIGTDFHLFVCSIFIIAYLHRQPKKGLALISFLIIASTIAKFYIVYQRELVIYITFATTNKKMFQSADEMYIISPYRFPVYGIGILVGAFLQHFKDTKLSKLQMSIGWFFANVSLVSTIAICTLNQTYSPFNDALFASVAPITLCLFTSWIIILYQFRQGSKFCFIDKRTWTHRF